MSATVVVVVQRDWADWLLGVGSLVLAAVAVGIAVWAQWSVRRERRKAADIETAWRVLETFRTWHGTQQTQRSVLTALLLTLRADDYPLLRLWVAPPDGYEPDNAALEAAIAGEYAAVVERRLA